MGDSLGFITTRGSALKKNVVNEFQAVTFVSHKSKKRKSFKESEIVRENNEHNEFNIKKAKHEVIKFGTSGFDSQKKEEAKRQLAIKLGAKPPKNKCINYKILKAEKKKEAEKNQSRMNFQQLGKNSIGKSSAKGKSFDRKRRKEKNDILGIYGKVKATTDTR